MAHALAASPLALMAWIGEKLFPLAKSPHLGLEFVVNMVSLWWLTETAPTSLYLYRDVFVGSGPEKWNKMLEGEPLYIPNETPIGYSGFMKELSVLPRSWAERTGRLVFYRRHETVGLWVSRIDGVRLTKLV